MHIRPSHIAVAILAVLLAVSCHKGPRRIPRKEMVDICYEMLYQDQLIRQSQVVRRQADTLLVYEGIFQEHGFNTDDYLYSVEYYLRDPERMAKIMAEAGKRLEAAARELTGEVQLYDWQQSLLAIYSKPVRNVLPKVPSLPLQLVRDSTGSGYFFCYSRDPLLQLDTLVLIPQPKP